MYIKQYCKALKLGGEGNEAVSRLYSDVETALAVVGRGNSAESPLFPTRDSRPGRPSESKYLTVFISGYTEY